MNNIEPSPINVGDNVIVRSVTYHYTGRVRAIGDKWLVLDDAAWVAHSGRWTNALTNGKLTSVEPYPGEVVLAVGAIVDVSPWLHPLPRTVV